MYHHFAMRRQHVGVVTACILMLACVLSACASTSAAPSHQIAVTATAPHPLTFYEGEDDLEPFTPFYVHRGPNGTVLAFGFAQNEGAFYITTYATTTWQETDISNGFAANDPLWACDQAADTSTTLADDATMMARACHDGSFTIFSLPNALTLYHQSGSQQTTTLTDRAPVVTFAPNGGTLAVTDDGTAGPGHTITLLNTHTWQSQGKIVVSAGLLSRPAWSADGAFIAAVDIAGALHIWNAQSGQETAHATLPQFAIGTAVGDIAGPAPQWSADGTRLVVTTPTSGGTALSSWSVAQGATLTQQAVVTLGITPAQLNPQIAPDGKLIFIYTAAQHGQILTTSDLKQRGDFALPGKITVWGSDAHHLDAFTLQATVVPLQVGG